MTLTIAGVGLVSPFGMTAADHVFFVRAVAVAPRPSPFVSAEGERIDARHCATIGARASIAERVLTLARLALHEAICAFERELPEAPIACLLCTPSPRPGFTTSDQEELSSAMRKRLRIAVVEVFRGDAGAFAALRRAQELTEGGKAKTVAIVAVDSHVSLDALTEHVKKPPSPWADLPPPPSEAAAALLVTTLPEARRAGLELGTVLGAEIATGTSSDDDDQILDGAALTKALRDLHSAAPIRAVLGQAGVDALRRREWHLASARCHGRFAPDLVLESLECHIGRVGAAAGLSSVSYGIALARHGVRAPDAVFLAWAISRDGTRGAGLFRGKVS